MAKSKKKTSLILSAVAIALCLLTIVAFFLPVLKSREEDAGFIKCSAMEICFISADKAAEISKEALKDGDLEKSTKFSTFATMKNDEKASPAFNATGWMFFIAMVASVVTLVGLLLSLAGKNTKAIVIFAAILALLAMIATLISSISFLNIEYFGSKLSDTAKISTGLIIALISSVLAPISLFVKIDGKKAV